MKIDTGNLFVRLGYGVSETLLPINAIKAMENSDNRMIKVYLKEEYCWKDYEYLMISGMTLEKAQDAINETIIKALKKIEEDA